MSVIAPLVKVYIQHYSGKNNTFLKGSIYFIMVYLFKSFVLPNDSMYSIFCNKMFVSSE